MDLTVEEGQRLKVIYGSCAGFHAVDVDSGSVYDIYLPTHVRKHPHTVLGWLRLVLTLPSTLLCELTQAGFLISLQCVGRA